MFSIQVDLRIQRSSIRINPKLIFEAAFIEMILTGLISMRQQLMKKHLFDVRKIKIYKRSLAGSKIYKQIKLDRKKTNKKTKQGRRKTNKINKARQDKKQTKQGRN